MAHDVFLSYSSKDKLIADTVCGTLEGKKIRCWVAPRDVLPGLPYGESLLEAIEASRVMVLIFSTSANESSQVMREVERASSESIPIIPLRIEAVLPSKSLADLISSPYWLDALTQPLERHLRSLAELVHSLLSKDVERGDPTNERNRTALGTEKEVSVAIAREMKPAHPKRLRQWLMVLVAVVLFLAGLIGLIIGIASSNPLPAKDAPPELANPVDEKPAPDTPPTVTNSIGLKLVLVKPGVFLMGSPVDEPERLDNEEQHEIKITRPFYVGVYEVSQEQYERVMGENPSFFSPRGGGQDKVKDMDTRQYPVENVSWEDAVEFCRRLSKMPEERAKHRVYRLPTEAEWEYVCRGGSFWKPPSPPFYFGNSLSSTQANFDGRFPYGVMAKGQCPQQTIEVGSYPANPLGLFDLHGSVWEWCSDWFDGDYYKRSPYQDPQGAKNGEYRVLRGGSWDADGKDCRAAYRHLCAPGVRLIKNGFRVVLFFGVGN